MNKTKTLVLLALLMAVHVILSMFFIQVADNLRIYFTYVVVVTIAIIFKPSIAITYAFVEDLVAFFLFPTGPFFMGYTLSAVVSMCIYSFFLKDVVNTKRIFIAKALVNLISNVALGSLWSAMLYSKGYIYYLTSSAIKNAVLLPFEVIIIITFLHLVTPKLLKLGLIKDTQVI